MLPEVDTSGVDPRLIAWLPVLDLDHRSLTTEELTVTSLRRPPAPRPSRHSPPGANLVTAADLRRWALDGRSMSEEWCRTLQWYYGRWLGVVLEPEWLTEEELATRGGLAAVQPHIHVQLKGEAWPST